jgi:hypothetical protein
VYSEKVLIEYIHKLGSIKKCDLNLANEY